MRCLFVAFSLFILVATQPAWSGVRAWTTATPLPLPNYSYLAFPHLSVSSAGVPRLLAPAILQASGPIESQALIELTTLELEWSDSSWVVSSDLGVGINWFRKCLVTSGSARVAGGGNQSNKHVVYWFTEAALPETVAVINEEYPFAPAGASSAELRWVIVKDGPVTRMFASRFGGTWSQFAVLPEDWYPSIAELSDTTAVVLLSDPAGGGRRWGLIRGTVFELIAEISHPWGQGELRIGKGGELLSAWTMFNTVAVSSLQLDSWDPGLEIACDYLTGVHGKVTGVMDMSREPDQDPAIVWSYQDFTGGPPGLCACLSQGGEFPTAENVAVNVGFGYPSVARDRNGDAWIAWWGYDTPGIQLHWMHSYTRATASQPTVTNIGGRLEVHWSLSEP